MILSNELSKYKTAFIDTAPTSGLFITEIAHSFFWYSNPSGI